MKKRVSLLVAGLIFAACAAGMNKVEVNAAPISEIAGTFAAYFSEHDLVEVYGDGEGQIDALTTDSSGQSLLNWVAMEGRIDLAEFLLSKNAWDKVVELGKTDQNLWFLDMIFMCDCGTSEAKKEILNKEDDAGKTSLMHFFENSSNRFDVTKVFGFISDCVGTRNLSEKNQNFLFDFARDKNNYEILEDFAASRFGDLSYEEKTALLARGVKTQCFANDFDVWAWGDAVLKKDQETMDLIERHIPGVNLKALDFFAECDATPESEKRQIMDINIEMHRNLHQMGRGVPRDSLKKPLSRVLTWFFSCSDEAEK